MDDTIIFQLITGMQAKGIVFHKGLTKEELIGIQERFGVIFPPDLQCFLQTALPVSPGFIHWRAGLKSSLEEKEIKNRMQSPWEGILFDIQYNRFWYKEWGEKPENYEEQKNIATRAFASYPGLIPVYGHRYMPRIKEKGAPVYSVYQTDIIYYGYNLADYIKKEFGVIINNFDYPDSVGVNIDFWNYFTE